MATGDYRQSWERVPEGPKPEGPPAYTPTTEEVRDAWITFTAYWGVPASRGGNPFNRWLASVRADAWDEGNRAHPKFGINPYRSDKQ